MLSKLKPKDKKEDKAAIALSSLIGGGWLWIWVLGKAKKRGVANTPHHRVMHKIKF